jgi:hypothetical protein
MTTLRTLEHCLEREMPLFHWRCKPGDNARLIPFTEIPEEIVVTAERAGEQVDGTPRHLNGRLLVQWGTDTTARLFSHEFMKAQSRAGAPLEWSWDKLADY